MTHTKTYPFAESTEVEEEKLISQALSGDSKSIEALLIRHEPWIYNLSFRMVINHEDAADVTQEILIKMITKLSTYNSEKARFKTWLYRIVTNHIINMKERNYEQNIPKLEEYYQHLHKVPDQSPDSSPEIDLVIKDLGISCVQGVLLCLERRQRLVFILAVVFQVSAKEGAELLEITPQNFRKILSRARSRLEPYMRGNCGLINPSAPCHCNKKVKTLLEAGALSPERIKFAQPGSPSIKEAIVDRASEFTETFNRLYADLSSEHPFYKSIDTVTWLKEVLEKSELKEILTV